MFRILFNKPKLGIWIVENVFSFSRFSRNNAAFFHKMCRIFEHWKLVSIKCIGLRQFSVNTTSNNVFQLSYLAFHAVQFQSSARPFPFLPAQTQKSKHRNFRFEEITIRLISMSTWIGVPVANTSLFPSLNDAAIQQK